MKKQNGLTLIELMVTLAVAIVLVAVGIPAFRSTTANNRAVAHSNALVTALTLSRGEAVKRGSPVAICRRPESGAVDCNTDSNDWASGWVVFDDIDNSGTVDDGESIRVWDAPSGNPAIVALDDSATEVYSVVFGPLGTQVSAGVPTFTITNPDCFGRQVREVSVSATGQVSTERADCP